MVISYFFFFKQKTAYEMRISDWSSDVCSSDLLGNRHHGDPARQGLWLHRLRDRRQPRKSEGLQGPRRRSCDQLQGRGFRLCGKRKNQRQRGRRYSRHGGRRRSEEHTSELQSLMRTSYAVSCLKKKKSTKSHRLNTDRI